MGRKAKISYEEKIKASEDYINGMVSAKQIAERLNLGKWGEKRIRLWAKKYREYGPESLAPKLKKEDMADVAVHHVGDLFCFHYVLSEFELPEKMKKIDPELSLSDEFYHRYIRINDSKEKDKEKLTAELEEIVLDYRYSGIREFEDLSLTLLKWKTEILNSFCEIEGRNSLIKKILKLANGYSNFKRFRNRIMYSLNKLARHLF